MSEQINEQMFVHKNVFSGKSFKQKKGCVTEKKVLIWLSNLTVSCLKNACT